MDFKINKQRANRAAEIAKMTINKNYGGVIPKHNMVCIVTANKVSEEARKVSYNFRFELTKNQPYVGQVIVNEDLSVTKICEVIG